MAKNVYMVVFFVLMIGCIVAWTSCSSAITSRHD